MWIFQKLFKLLLINSDQLLLVCTLSLHRNVDTRLCALVLWRGRTLPGRRKNRPTIKTDNYYIGFTDWLTSPKAGAEARVDKWVDGAVGVGQQWCEIVELIVPVRKLHAFHNNNVLSSCTCHSIHDSRYSYIRFFYKIALNKPKSFTISHREFKQISK